MKRLFAAAVAGMVFAIASPVTEVGATVSFTFTYFDVETSTGVGFDDPVEGPARIAALELVAADIGSKIGQTATVEIGIAPSQTDGMDFIGLASSTFTATGPGILDGDIYRRIVLGEPDPDPATLDGGMVFDFGYAVALSGTPAAGIPYWPDIARHELTHALGFGSNLAVDSPTMSPGDFTRYDSFVTTDLGAGMGLPVVDASGSVLLSTTDYAAAWAGGFVFDGPMTRAANGGLPLELFPGSPSHSFDPTDVMYVSPAIGFARDEWSAPDVAVLRDLGYIIIPEPDAVALIGLGLGFVLPRRRRAAPRR